MALKHRAAAVVAGVALLSAGVFGLLRRQHLLGTVSHVAKLIQVTVKWSDDGPFGIPLPRSSTHITPIPISVEYPKLASSGDSFPVRVFLGASDASDTLESISLTLSAAGLEVKPDSAVKLTLVGQRRTAAWSARATVPGTYTLILNSATALSLEDMPTIVVKITSRWSTLVQNGWPYVSSFFGSLLTLPGILAYFKERRTARAAAKFGSGKYGGPAPINPVKRRSRK
jgi:hypothetical protein